MRKRLKDARVEAGLKTKDIAAIIGVKERYYYYIEAGQREGKGTLWDALEALFEYKIPQRQLRQNDSHPDYSKTTETAK